MIPLGDWHLHFFAVHICDTHLWPQGLVLLYGVEDELYIDPGWIELVS